MLKWGAVITVFYALIVVCLLAPLAVVLPSDTVGHINFPSLQTMGVVGSNCDRPDQSGASPLFVRGYVLATAQAPGPYFRFLLAYCHIAGSVNGCCHPLFIIWSL